MPNFEEIYGKQLGEMDAGEKEIALFSYLERIDNHLEVLNGKTKPIRKMEILTYAHSAFIAALATVFAWFYQNPGGR